MRVQRDDVRSGVARHEDLVADAAHVDDDVIAAARDDLAAYERDHSGSCPCASGDGSCRASGVALLAASPAPWPFLAQILRDPAWPGALGLSRRRTIALRPSPVSRSG